MIGVAVLFVALSASARVDVVHKTGLPAGRDGVEREKFLCGFDACSFNLEYSVRDGAVFREKWGDYFFGLHLGYSPKNGGWNMWEFLQVYVRTSAGPKSDDFKAAMRIALDIGVDRGALNVIARRYLDAAKRRDIAMISDCAAEVNRLRSDRGLAEFGAEKKI